MKKTLSIILALCIIISMLPQTAVFASAVESGTCGDNLTWTLDASGTLAISGSGAMYDYNYSSDAPWYSSSWSIKKVTIGDSVTTIGRKAFSYCRALTSVTIGDSVTTIGDYAFYSCTSLTSVTIGDSVTTIGGSAFSDCYSLTTVTIPDSVTTIGDSAFDGCTSLTSVTIGDSVTTIGERAFGFCTSLTSVTIGDSVTTIGERAFDSCSALTSVTIPDSVTSIGNSAFYYCSALTSVAIPDSVTTIGDSAFDGCYALSSVTIGDSVTTIGGSAFGFCTSLTSVTIGDSVTTIGDSAFRYCSALTSVTIPDSVTMIGDNAFSGCGALTSVTIPDSVTMIGDNAFSGCDALTSVTIGDSVTTIGDSAFRYCRALTSVTIPDSVTTIGDEVFYSCDSLTAIEVDMKNTAYCDINGVLFNKTKTMLVQYPTGKKGAYTIPDSVTTIGGYAFSHCSALTSVTIPDSVTTIGGNAFSGCDALASVTIGDSVTTIGDYAFYDCYALSSVTIPDSVTTIGDYAFSWCDALTSVTIPDSVTSIGTSAFSRCYALSDVYYGGSKEEWARISIASNNDPLASAAIHYNSVSDSPITPEKPTGITLPTNEAVILGKGTAFGRFEIKNAAGDAARNKPVYYSIDGGAEKTGVTNEYGYITVSVANVSTSKDYSIRFRGSGITAQTGTLSVTVKPIEFTSKYDASITLGANVGAGIGIGGSIGDLKGEAKVADIGAEGSAKRGLSIEQEYTAGKTKLKISTTQNLDAAVEAKAGLFAEGNLTENIKAKVSAAEVSGNVSYGNVFGVGYENEDFSFSDSEDVDGLSKFLIAAVLESCGSNAATRYIVERIGAPVNSRETGSAFVLGAGASVGVASLGDGTSSVGATLAGVGVESVWSNSTETESDGTEKYKSGLSAAADVSACTLKLTPYEEEFGNKTEAKISTKVSAFSYGEGSNLSFGAERDKAGNLKEISLSQTAETEKGILLSKETETDTLTVKYTGAAADSILGRDKNLSSFSNGDKKYFSLSQFNSAAKTMANPKKAGEYEINHEKIKGFDLNLSASLKILLEIGGKIGISGAEGYEYVAERGTYDGLAYVQSINDIETEVDKGFISVEEMIDMTVDAFKDVLDTCWQGIKKKASEVGEDVLQFGQGLLKGISNGSKKVISLFTTKDKTKTMSVLAVADTFSLFSTASVATTVGDPYIIAIEDEEGNRIDDFSDEPLTLVLEYTDEDIAEAGASDLSNIAILRWDDEKNVYVRLGGEHNATEKCVELEITKPGQYILAVDNCPPAITLFEASDGGKNCVISATVSDLSGISDFEFYIDDMLLLDKTNFEEKYNHVTAEFEYATSGLAAGEHTAKLYVKDSFGNYTEDTLLFTVSDDVPQITSITKLPETVDGQATVEAEVSGEDILSVHLNTKLCDAFGNEKTETVEMKPLAGTYTAKTPKIPTGCTARVWISAYNSLGNSTKSEEQEILSMKLSDSEPAIAITSVSQGTVEVKCKNLAVEENASVLLAVYDAGVRLLYVTEAPAEETVVFENVAQGEQIKAFLWQDMKPLCEATSAQKIK